MNEFTDYDRIERDLMKRCDDLCFNYEHAWKVLVVSTWNILNRINCADFATYETVINGMGNAYNAGIENYRYDIKKKENL